MRSWIEGIVNLVLIPGVVLHELAHKKFCDWTGVPVRKVRYFRFGNPAGYVEHDEPSRFYQMFLISTGPLFINSLIAVLAGFLISHARLAPSAQLLVFWVGFSAAACAFPSDADMRHLLGRGFFLSLAMYPLYGLVWLANKLRFFGFDLLYAFALVLLGFAL